MQHADHFPSPISEAYKLDTVASFPTYDRRTATGIGHLGMGNFHRSHQAVIINRLLQQQGGNWMIQAASMLPHEDRLVSDLQEQGTLYTVIERSGEQHTAHVIGSIAKALHAPSDPEGVINAFSSDNTKIISLTVTEKGYSNTPSGDLDIDNALVQHDLLDNPPKTTLGYLYAIAKRRMQEKGAAVTVMSCDNLVGNGDRTERLLHEFTALKDPAVGKWIADNMTFPNSMVDRITPATTPEVRDYVANTIGIADKCPVVCEPFFQWVIEDTFANDRPNLEEYGVQIVPSVKPYELLKTRMLNGSHSALAYPAYLMGHRKVDNAMADPLIYDFVRRFMDEDITAAIPPVPGIDVEDYKKTLLTRFSNHAISDNIERLALDTSAKIGTYIVPALTENIEHGRPIKWTAFALAACCRYLTGYDEEGNTIEINDPLEGELRARAKSPVDLLRFEAIFGPNLTNNRQFITEVMDAHALITELGTREALRRQLGK